MKYFKNTELANLYHVSEKTVRNWISAAQEGKLDLQLHTNNDRVHIANTVRNNTVIEELTAKGRKYKNRRGFKVVSPTPDFYKTYDQKEILNIISNLTIHKEIPLQYTYFNGGAEYWDQYTRRLSNENAPNILTRTVELLDTTFGTIEPQIKRGEKVNVIDLGPGNGMPIKGVLDKLVAKGLLNKYIAIDTSKEMLDILEKNIKAWFGNKVNMELHTRDFSHERFDDLTANYSVKDDADIPTNMVFFLGNTLNNFRNPGKILSNINDSLGINDLFFYSCYLDTSHTRRYFDFNFSGQDTKLAPIDQLMLDFLNIDEKLYDVDQVFSEEKRARSISIRPKVDIQIKFNFANITRRVELLKNESILLWRGRHKNAVEIINMFDENGFDLMQATKSEDQHYMLMASKIKVGFDIN